MVELWENKAFKVTDILNALIIRERLSSYKPGDFEEVYIAPDTEEMLIYRIFEDTKGKYYPEKAMWILECGRHHKSDLCEFIKEVRGETRDLTTIAAQESYLHDFSQNRLSEYIIMLDDSKDLESWAHKAFDSYEECIEGIPNVEIN